MVGASASARRAPPAFKPLEPIFENAAAEDMATSFLLQCIFPALIAACGVWMLQNKDNLQPSFHYLYTTVSLFLVICARAFARNQGLLQATINRRTMCTFSVRRSLNLK